MRYEVNAVIPSHCRALVAGDLVRVRERLAPSVALAQAFAGDGIGMEVATGLGGPSAYVGDGSHSDRSAQNHFILQMCDSNFVPCHIIIMAVVRSFIVARMPRESL